METVRSKYLCQVLNTSQLQVEMSINGLHTQSLFEVNCAQRSLQYFCYGIHRKELRCSPHIMLYIPYHEIELGMKS
jgi:hypothetical protein